jgi:hypothetical protein
MISNAEDKTLRRIDRLSYRPLSANIHKNVESCIARKARVSFPVLK